MRKDPAPTSTLITGISRQQMKQKMIEIETHSYNSYIAEVTALNSVKEFLSENRATLSGPLKQKLIQ